MSRFALPLAACLAALAVGGCSGTPTVQTGPDAETIDGKLYRVDNTAAQLVYVDPTVDFSRYNRVLLAPLGLDNVEIIQPDNSSAPYARKRDWELTDEDRAALQAQMDALAQRDATLTAFVANTTHDVMIPLTVLQGHLVGLRRRLEDGSTEQELAELALEESDYLGALMQNLGAAARLDARDQPLELGPVDLGALVERVMTRHAPIAAQKGVQIDHAVPPTPLRARGDLTLLERLVGNLVHNAVRYNREGGHVAVVLEATEGGFTLRVLDDGPGVTPEELPRLGERRFRSEAARTRQPGGSGLGLAIARDVAERHGFALRFEANAPQGLAAILSGPRLDGSEPGSEAS